MAGETVTRIRAGASPGDDRYGDPIPGADVETAIAGGFFAPGGTSEPVEVGRAPVISEPTVYFPHAWPDIAPTDRLRIRGDVYQVTGDPGDWRSPQGSTVGGLVVPLKKVDG